MPIEFRCTSCDRLLRVPDESVGKRARCPACGTTVPVPGTAAEPPREPDAPQESPLSSPAPNVSSPPAASVPPSDRIHNPFADAPARDPYGAADAATNPYAAPGDTFTKSVAGAHEAGQHTHIDFNEILQRSWQVLTNQLGPCLLLGVIFVGIYMILQVIDQVGQGAVSIIEEPILIAAFFVASTIIRFLVDAFINLGGAIYTLSLVRYGRAEVGQIFQGGPYYLRALLFTLLIYIIAGLIVAACIAPAGVVWATVGEEEALVAAVVGAVVAIIPCIIVFLKYQLAIYFFIDRQSGVLEGMRESSRYMRGNMLVTFGTYFIVGSAGTLFVCITCCIGSIAYWPFLLLVRTVIYLMATGQYFAPMPGELSATSAVATK